MKLLKDVIYSKKKEIKVKEFSINLINVIIYIDYSNNKYIYNVLYEYNNEFKKVYFDIYFKDSHIYQNEFINNLYEQINK